MLIQADEGEYFAAIPRSISMSSAGVDSPQIAILSRDTSEIDFLTAQEEFNWQTSVSERGAAQLHSEPRVRHTGMTETCNHCQLNYSSVSQIPKEVAHKHYSEKQAVQETAKRETASSDDELKTENLVGRYSSGLGYGMSLSFNSVNLIEVACSDLLTDAPTPRNSMNSSSRNSTLEPTDGMTMENSSSMVQLLKKLTKYSQSYGTNESFEPKECENNQDDLNPLDQSPLKLCEPEVLKFLVRPEAE